MEIKKQNNNYIKRISYVIVNSNEKGQNNLQKIENLINYEQNNIEKIKIEEKKIIKRYEKTKIRTENAYNFNSNFLEQNYFINDIISNYILEEESTQNSYIKIDTNKLNENHVKNKDYNLFKNNILYKNYFEKIAIISVIINIL